MSIRTPQNPVIGIIADDLTSAADGACPFIAKGLSAIVRCAGAVPPVFDNHQIVSIDCDSRNQSEARAVRSIANATGFLAGASLLYKTMDSTLRGHVTAEISAAYRASGRERIVIAPAFPNAGRITRGGVQFVDGIPVLESKYAYDPVHPAKTSRISELIPATLKSVTILDAETQSNLNAQVAAIESPENILWIGFPGLAIALAELKAGRQPSRRPLPSSSKCLVVVGSANDVSCHQVEQLQESDRVTVLSAPYSRSLCPQKVLQILVCGAIELISTGHFDALIATGGETMAALLNELTVKEFSLLGEFEPGFPLGVGALPSEQLLIIGLKAGGFGSKDTLASAVKALQPSIDQHPKVF